MAARKGAATVLISTVICAAVIIGALEWEKTVALPSPFGQVINGVHHYTIDEFNYYYKPDYMTWHVGEKVSLTIDNRSQS
ncbi:hypothetical protein OW565_14095, partial [Acidithiobacillus ferriphilus]|nr:hypothetical protein [Acidithiobacillus ferriphilus]